MHPFNMVQICFITACLLSSASYSAKQPYDSIGYKLTAIPIINFSSDDGTGYGVRTNVYDYDGSSIPYRRAYSMQAFFTSGGKWVHRLKMDIPNLRPGHRLQIEAVYEKEEFANYYGDLSDESLVGLSREQKTFKHANSKLNLMWIRDLYEAWRLRAGFKLSHQKIRPNAVNGSILQQLKPLGINGGILFQANSSLRYDTRDNYINSTRGILEELLIEYSGGGDGDFNSVRLSYEHRHFFPFFDRLVLAQRANADMILGDTPFYEKLKLGGANTVRGLAAAHLRAQGRLLFNSELRWRGLQLPGKQAIFTGLLLFWDIGRVFEPEAQISWGQWRNATGVGLRFHWHSTIVRADYGKSGSRTGLYITFSQVF